MDPSSKPECSGSPKNPATLNPTLATPQDSGSLQFPPGFDPEKETFSRYKDIQEIDRGGMGSILTARDPHTDRQIVVKTLLPKFAQQPHFAQRFLREAQITAQLEHPNIIPIHDVGHNKDVGLYIAMKRVHGDSLAARIRTDRNRGRPTSRSVSLQMFLKICEALSLAHSRGVIHRDLKPANIMIGEFGEVLVMDWGIAKLIGTQESTAEPLDSGKPEEEFETAEDLTQDGQLIGTIRYMSPEQAEGCLDRIDPRSDIYSLGAVLYETLTLEPVHRGQHRTQILTEIARGAADLALNRKAAKHLPREIVAIIRKAMNIDPEHRYSSVKDLANDIRSYLEGGQLAAAQYNPVQLLTKWVRRNRKMCSGGAAVFLVALLVFGLVGWKERRDRENRFSAAGNEAARLVREVGDIESLTKKRPAVDPETGVERKETPPERGARKQAIEAYVAAAEALDRALQIRPGEEDASRQRIQVGRAIGVMALQGRDYLLARQAFLQLQRHGVPKEEITEFVDQVEIAEWSILALRKERLEFILDDLTRGLFRKDRSASDPLIVDYVFEAVSYRDPQTVMILAEDLRKLIVKQKKEGKTITWNQPERDRATFICRVLGRLGLAECVEPLKEWIQVVTDHQMAVEAGVSLCNTRRQEAESHLVALRARLGVNSKIWLQIAPHFGRIPSTDSDPLQSGLQEALDRAHALFFKKQFANARRWADRALELQPNSLSGWVILGRIHEGLQHPDLALEAYERALKIDPKSIPALLNRGAILLDLNRLEEALNSINQLLELDPDSALAYQNRASVYLKSRQFQKAISDLTTAIQIDPIIAKLYNNRALAHSYLGHIEKALSDYNQAIELDPNRSPFYNNRGGIFQRLKRYEEALADFNRAIELDPRSADAYSNRGIVYWRQKQNEKALADYKQALLLDPNHSGTYRVRGILYNRKKWNQKALKDFDKAIELNPNDSSSYRNRSVVHYQLGQPDKALSDLARAIQLNPNSADAYYKRARIYQELQKLPDAVKDFSRAIEIAPRQASFPFERGTIYLRLKQFGKALTDFNRSLDLDPTQIRCRVNRALTYKYLGQPAKALTEFDRAIELAPTFAPAYINRGYLHRSQKRLEKALQDFNRAIQVAPNHPTGHLARGDLLRKREQHQEAAISLRRYLQLVPRSPQRAEIEKYMAKHPAAGTTPSKTRQKSR